MKFLIDMPLSPTLADWLRERGHDAVHASTIGLACAPDSLLVEKARETDRAIITADLGFPRLLALSGRAAPGILLFRGGNYGEDEVRVLLGRVLSLLTSEQLKRSVTVIERGRIRRTELPLRPPT